MSGEVEFEEHLYNEAPLKAVVSFVKVQFDKKTAFMTFFVFEVINHSLEDDDIVHTLAAWEKTRLERANKTIQKRS